MLATLVVASPSGARSVPPRDECATDASFASFRSGLLDTLARRDAARLRAVLAQDIAFSFGDSPGVAGFEREWGLAEPVNSALWSELGRVLLLGCARTADGAMASPYLFSRFPEDTDTFTGAVALPGTRLYQARSNEAEGSVLAWDLFTSAEPDGNGWARVRLADGRSGYVASQGLLSPIGYRAIFERRGGQWRMTAFIAGD